MKSNTFMAIMFTLGFGAYFGVQGAQKIAGTQPFSSAAELRVAMEEDADNLAIATRETLAQSPDSSFTIATPVVDVEARAITLDFALDDIGPSPQAKAAFPIFERSIRDQSCPTYLQSVMALNEIELIYALKFNDGSEFGAVSVNREACKKHRSS